MRDRWQYQLRVYLDDAVAERARRDPADPALAPLKHVLDRHDATLVSQLDAFEAYVAEAERDGPEQFPLYTWTVATLADPEKRRKHARAFALRVHGDEVYAREAADVLEADLQPLLAGPIVLRLSRHDTNPANNMPIPAEYRA